MIVQITQNGKTVSTGASSANTTLPLLPAGDCRYVRVAVSARCYIKFGVSGVTVSASDGILMVPGTPEVFAVVGQTHVAYIDGPDATVSVNLAPVDSAR